MMKKGLLFLIIILASCKEQTATPEQAALIGTWEYLSSLPVSSEFPKGSIKLKKTAQLPDNNTAMLFKANKDLLARDGIGRCASPISFSTFSGRWTLKNGELTIRKKTWDEEATIHYKIVSVDKDQLIMAIL